MARTMKSARDVRHEAVLMARGYAREQERCGDPEGAGVLRDLALQIERIRLTEET